MESCQEFSLHFRDNEGLWSVFLKYFNTEKCNGMNLLKRFCRIHSWKPAGLHITRIQWFNGFDNITGVAWNTLSQNKFHSFQNLRIQDLREQSLDLHRDIQSSARELGVKGHHVTNFVLPGGVPLFTAKMGEPGYLGNNTILGEVRPILFQLANWWAVVFMWTTFCNFKFGSGLVCGMALGFGQKFKHQNSADFLGKKIETSKTFICDI